MKPLGDKIVNENPVTIFLNEHIKKCKSEGKSQKEIADEAGYATPNNMTMLKQGKSKVPLDKAPAIAKAINANPAEFVRICIETYFPGVFEAMSKTMPLPRNKVEAELFDAIRGSLDNSNIKKNISNPALVEDVKACIAKAR